MKIIQNDVYSSDKWHTSKQNIWSTSYLQGTLNTTYWDTISSTYQAMIDQNHIWKIGASSHEATRAEAYSNLSADTWTGKVGLMNTAEPVYI
ncbi:MAG: hypothetical protein HFH31_00730 [Bacilli bacterium]|nr:hypothetical protein [Bacilli bacterium]